MTGQTMISAAFFVMLTVAVLSANKMVIESNRDYIEAQAVEQGTNFANALISEILTKKFDSNVTLDAQGKITGPYDHSNWPWPSTPTDFDDPTAMGASSATKNRVMPGGSPDVAPYKSVRGDNSDWFDDVDDYNTYERTADAGDIQGYHLKVKVYYVSKNNPDTPITTYWSQTYYKRIDVTVDHPLYLPKKLKFSAIATY